MNREQLTELGFDVRRFEAEEREEWKREEWGDGPWRGEGVDRVEWRKPGSPLPRLVVRGPHGSWCGYVGMPPGHPLHGKPYDEPRLEECEVHGGVTFANECGGHICHVPGPGEPEHVWWIGFDCSHAYDLSPRLEIHMRKAPGYSAYGTYRPLEYVVLETERLAAQLGE